MNAEELKQRTKASSLRVVKLAAALPKNQIANIFIKQLVRSGTSVAANYRAACLARSQAEFVAKIGIVREEADETVFWMEMACDAGLIKKDLVEDLISEGKEILAIVIASHKTAKSRNRKQAKKSVKKSGGK